MPISKIVAVGGAFIFVIIAGEWIMMQSHGNKGEAELLGIAGNMATLGVNQEKPSLRGAL